MSANPGTYNFPPIVKGDTFGELTIDGSGNVIVAPFRFSFNINIVGSIIKMQFRSSINATSALKSLTSEGEEPGITAIADTEDDAKWIMSIEPFTADFPAGTVYYDVQITTPEPNVSTNTYFKGTVTVINDVTQ